MERVTLLSLKEWKIYSDQITETISNYGWDEINYVKKIARRQYRYIGCELEWELSPRFKEKDRFKLVISQGSGLVLYEIYLPASGLEEFLDVLGEYRDINFLEEETRYPEFERDLTRVADDVFFMVNDAGDLEKLGE